MPTERGSIPRLSLDTLLDPVVLLREVRDHLLEAHPCSDDAPGHSHDRRGRWDADGSPCAWCATWQRVQACFGLSDARVATHQETNMREITFEQVQAMDLASAKSEICNRVYEAAILFERFEDAGKVHGNGHHIAQSVAAFAEKLMADRWIANDDPCDCSFVLNEGEMIDLQGIEIWLSASDDVTPPVPLGRGLRLRWLKTLANILDQSNAGLEPLARRDHQ